MAGEATITPVVDEVTADLLDMIRKGGAATRGELIASTGFARSTVAHRVDALLATGLIKAVGEAESTGGGPPSLLGFNGGAGVVLAADLGATHSRIAVTDLDAQILAETSAELDINEGPDAVLDWLDGVFHQLVAEADHSMVDVKGIGIGLPGPVDFDRGMAVDPPIMAGWHEYPVSEHLREGYGVPVLVDNDVNIMAAGEYWSMTPEPENLIFVKVGTGIGSGLILGGRLHRGDHGAAGDIGHVNTAESETICRCGNTGCLEASAGGGALATSLRAKGHEVVDSRGVVALVEAGDKDAVRAVRAAGRQIGHVLATTVNLLNPRVIVLGGDISHAERQLLAGIREVVYQRSTTLSTQDLRITTSELGDRAGVIGAASMVIDHVLAPGLLERTFGLEAAGVG